MSWSLAAENNYAQYFRLQEYKQDDKVLGDRFSD